MAVTDAYTPSTGLTTQGQNLFDFKRVETKVSIQNLNLEAARANLSNITINIIFRTHNNMDVILLNGGITEASLIQRYIGPYKIAHWCRKHGYDTQVLDFVEICNEKMLYNMIKKFITPKTLVIGVSTTFMSVNTFMWSSGDKHLMPEAIYKALKKIKEESKQIANLPTSQKINLEEIEQKRLEVEAEVAEKKRLEAEARAERKRQEAEIEMKRLEAEAEVSRIP